MTAPVAGCTLETPGRIIKDAASRLPNRAETHRKVPGAVLLSRPGPQVCARAQRADKALGAAARAHPEQDADSSEQWNRARTKGD